MPAGRHVSRNPRCEDILVAEGAHIACATRAANVRRTRAHAHLACITVHVIFASTDATKSTAIAVKLLFVHIVIEAAGGAEVGGAEGECAASAGGTNGLLQTAAAALYRLD